MPVLEFLTATMLAISAALKVRSLRRAGMGVPPLPLLEFVTAALMLVMALLRVTGGGGVPRWAVPLAFVLLIVSTVDHLRLLARVQHRRLETEAGRLQAYVTHLSDGPGRS